MLIRKKVFDDPETWVVNKSFTNSQWGKDVYCQVYSSALAYVYVPGPNAMRHTIDIEADPCWNRLIYTDQAYGQSSRTRSHGTFGFGVDSLNEPMAVKVVSQTSDLNPISDHYYIYVADRQNHRVERLHYTWTWPDSGLIHDYYCTAAMWRPTDLDVSNGGLFDNPGAYEIWVACKDNFIYAFRFDGSIIMSYGGIGSGFGQFNDIRAIVCGKTRYNSSTGTWFANNDYVYVLDAGNSRIVRLLRDSYYNLVWDQVYTNPVIAHFTDLEVDACGHLWATSSDGTVFKFTYYLDPLGVFGSSGTGANQFDYPVSIANTGGHMGGGDMMICENWTEQSGLQCYAVGVDITDLAVNPQIWHDTCLAVFTFTLVDYSLVVAKIYNSNGVLVRDLLNGEFLAATWVGSWDGVNNAHHLVPWGSYRMEVTATSFYKSIDTGQPVSSVTKSVWFTLCESACRCGDANNDHSIDISDQVFIINFIFAGGPPPGDCINQYGMGDANGDAAVDIGDVVYIGQYIFAGGPEPQCP
jgi:hypothetical protein